MIGKDYPCFVIGEIGVNHNGNLDTAKELFKVAVRSGVDAVKFQTFKAREIVSPDAPKAGYQLRSTDPDESQLAMLEKLELSIDAHVELKKQCDESGLVFLSTPFDRASADLLYDLDVPAFKIGSGELTSIPFLSYVAGKGKPMIVSTGMSYLSEVSESVVAINDAGCDQLVLLHCVSNYPALPLDVNLNVLKTLADEFNLPIGYSDHTMGVEMTLAAVALGACVIEKHFTLDRSSPGPDHMASLEPDELANMVRSIRHIESGFGDGKKIPTESEIENRLIARRSLAASKNIRKGTTLTQKFLTELRPNTGISPTDLENVVGRRVQRDLSKGEILTWEDLE